MTAKTIIKNAILRHGMKELTKVKSNKTIQALVRYSLHVGQAEGYKNHKMIFEKQKEEILRIANNGKRAVENGLKPSEIIEYFNQVIDAVNGVLKVGA